MKILEKIARLYPSYAAAVFEKETKGSDYTESQCMDCPYEHKCCTYAVGVTPFEVIAIIDYIRKNFPDPKAMFKKIKSRVKTQKKHFRKYKKMEDGAKEWAKKNIYCVFYNKEKRQCSIYSVRPMNCRYFFSVDDCSTGIGRTITETKPVLKNRFKWVQSEKLDPSKPFELCETITIMNKDNNLKINDDFTKIIESFDQDK